MDKFLDLKVPVFQNKKNGQLSIALPKKKLREMFKEVPKSLGIRIRW